MPRYYIVLRMGLKIINYGDISKALELRAGKEESPHLRLVELLDIALTKAIAKEGRFFQIQEEYPDHPPKWLTREMFQNDGPFHRFDPDSLSQDTARIDHIIDWIHGALKDDAAWISDVDGKNRPIKLVQTASLDGAYNRADKAMVAQANRLRDVFGKSDKNFYVQEARGDIKTVKRLDGGARIVQLLTPQALDYETSCISHCIGNGNYDDRIKNLDKFQYYSFRDAQNKAHAT